MQRNRSTCEQSTLLFDVWLVTHLTTCLLDEALRPLGLTGDEFGLYSLIRSFGPLTGTQVSRLTGMAPTTVSGMVRRITDRGHATQVANPDDARSRLLHLSEAGVRVADEAGAVLTATLPRLHDALRTGPAAVRASLGDLDAGLRQLTGASPRPYDLAEAEHSEDPPAVTYEGAHLTGAQTAEVRSFVDWVRARDLDRPQRHAPEARRP
jgi:DNA-binding MarR family transcriptional regulator